VRHSSNWKILPKGVLRKYISKGDLNSSVYDPSIYFKTATNYKCR
jgi:hypothetical protein